MSTTNESTVFVAVLVHKECGREAAPDLADHLRAAGLAPDNARLIFGDMPGEMAIMEEMIAEYGWKCAPSEKTDWDDLTTKPVDVRTNKKGQPYNFQALAVRNNKMVKRSQRAAVVYPKGAEFAAVHYAWKALGPDNVVLARIQYVEEGM